MQEFQSRIFKDNFSIDDDMRISGTSSALGTLQAFSIVSEKELTVNSNLESTRGSIKAKSSLKIGKDLISAKDIEVRGSCIVAGNIEGEKVRFYGSALKANSIKATTITLGGNIYIQDGLNALESIWIPLNPKRTEVKINGVIKAPEVTIAFVGFFSKWFLLPDILLNKLKKKTRLKKGFLIKNLSIKTQELIIQTYYPSERVDIEFIDCDIDAPNIEFVQVKNLDHLFFNEN
jgi:cytoskeletal protein CcmA (bactofilin family)